MIVTSGELAVFDQASRALDEARSLEEIKSIRDKAEAARHFVKAAKLGLVIQNRAAEVKLRAERRAGELLRSLGLRGGDRKSKRQAASLKLVHLGISRDQSKRWQHMASVSDSEFSQYLRNMTDENREITSAGLLRIAAKGRSISSNNRSWASQRATARPLKVGGTAELLEEMMNHCTLLGQVLQPITRDLEQELKRGERRVVGRLIREITSLCAQLKNAL